MFETKNLLMLVILYTGFLTAVAGTGITMLTPALAIDDDCEDNGDDRKSEYIKKTNVR